MAKLLHEVIGAEFASTEPPQGVVRLYGPALLRGTKRVRDIVRTPSSSQGARCDLVQQVRPEQAADVNADVPPRQRSTPARAEPGLTRGIHDLAKGVQLTIKLISEPLPLSRIRPQTRLKIFPTSLDGRLSEKAQIDTRIRHLCVPATPAPLLYLRQQLHHELRRRCPRELEGEMTKRGNV